MWYAKLGLGLVASVVLTAPVAIAQQTKESPPPLGTASFIPPESKKHEPLTPENFVVRAGIANLAEIQAAELALKKFGDTAIRNLATQVLRDYRASHAKLKALAAEVKIALPGTVDEDTRQQNQQLSERVGADFDRAFLERLHAGHAQSLALYQQAPQANLPPSFKRYAEEAAKLVESHRDRVEKLRAEKNR